MGIFVLGAVKTFARNTDWRDNITLYSSDAADGPGFVRDALEPGHVLLCDPEFFGGRERAWIRHWHYGRTA